MSSYKILKEKWYLHLKATGFNDIEYKGDNLKQDFNHKLTINNLSQQETLAYYINASHFLTEFKFESELDYNIWLHYSDGKSIRSTASILGVGRGLVYFRLKKSIAVFNIWMKSL